MDELSGVSLLEEGAIAEAVLQALTFDDLCSLSRCGGRLAQLLRGSGVWLRAAVSDVCFLQVEAPCFQATERVRMLRAVRALKTAVPARGTKVQLDTPRHAEELAGAVATASRASGLHLRSGGGFAAPLVAFLRWRDQDALDHALTSIEPEEEFCVAAPISLPPAESTRLAGAMGLNTGCRGPPRPIRIFFAWRDGELLVAIVEGGLLADRLELPMPSARPTMPPVLTFVRLHVQCLCPELPLPEVSLEIPMSVQWVAVPLELPEDKDVRSAAISAMVKGALCVMTVTDCECQRTTSWINTLGLQPLSTQGPI